MSTSRAFLEDAFRATAFPLPTLMSLYAMSEELTCLVDTADMVAEGTIERGDLDRAIARFQAALPQKVDQTAWALAFLESQAELGRKETKRLQARVASIDGAIERLESYCVAVIEKLPAPKKGARKLEGESCTLSIRPSDATLIKDEAAVPIDYKTVALEMPARAWQLIASSFPQIADILDDPRVKDSLKYAIKVRVADVKKALKSGAPVDGAELEFRNNLVRK